MRDAFVRALSVVAALAYGATLAACSSPQQTPAAPAAAPAAIAKSTAVGKLEVSRSGSGLTVRLINPKDGASSAFSAYAKLKSQCNNGPHPCYIFSAINGTAPLPVSGDCPVVNNGGLPTAYCAATGVASLTVDAPTGGTIGRNASGSSELGKDCFPSSVIYEAGDKDVYSILAWDGCKDSIHCLGHNVGTVDADSKDVIQGPCYYVDRH
jgi:hypothetical protein